jgi:hypothetical protein
MGPYKKSSLQSWYYRGFLGSETLVCLEGQQVWMPISSVPKLDEIPKYVSKILKATSEEPPQKWWNDPASEKQLAKLHYFEIRFLEEGLTKKQASDLINFFIEVDPEKERQYQNQPATPEQRKAISELGGNDTGLTLQQAQELLKEWTAYDTGLDILNDIINDDDWLRLHSFRRISRVKLIEMKKILDDKHPDWETETPEKIVHWCPSFFQK